MRADARRNRDAIISAARSVFENDEQLRFDDFAARAGVGIGTLYRHFPTRESLVAAVYQGEIEALCGRARDSTRPAGETLDRFVHAFVDHVVENTALARTLAAVVDADTQAAGGGELERTLGALMARGVAEGSVRDDVTRGAVLIALHGVGSATERPEWAAEAQVLADVVVRGLAAD